MKNILAQTDFGVNRKILLQKSNRYFGFIKIGIIQRKI